VKDIYKKFGIDLQNFSDEYITRVISLMRERARRLTDFAANGRYFFEDPMEYDAKARKKHFREGTVDKLNKLTSGLAGMEPFDARALEAYYHDLVEAMKLPNAAKLIHPTRLAVSGLSFGPGLFELLELLGRDTVLRRLEKAIEYLEKRDS
jgi:glutamyl-tRNA synthetase